MSLINNKKLIINRLFKQSNAAKNQRAITKKNQSGWSTQQSLHTLETNHNNLLYPNSVQDETKYLKENNTRETIAINYFENFNQCSNVGYHAIRKPELYRPIKRSLYRQLLEIQKQEILSLNMGKKIMVNKSLPQNSLQCSEINGFSKEFQITEIQEQRSRKSSVYKNNKKIALPKISGCLITTTQANKIKNRLRTQNQYKQRQSLNKQPKIKQYKQQYKHQQQLKQKISLRNASLPINYINKQTDNNINKKSNKNIEINRQYFEEKFKDNQVKENADENQFMSVQLRSSSLVDFGFKKRENSVKQKMRNNKMVKINSLRQTENQRKNRPIRILREIQQTLPICSNQDGLKDIQKSSSVMDLKENNKLSQRVVGKIKNDSNSNSQKNLKFESMQGSQYIDYPHKNNKYFRPKAQKSQDRLKQIRLQLHSIYSNRSTTSISINNQTDRPYLTINNDRQPLKFRQQQSYNRIR